MDDALAGLARKIADSRRVVAFTGSGISAESGIPTFRGEGGVWERYSPSLYANIPGILGVFLLRPSKIREFGTEVVSTFVKAEPNPAHRALASLESRGHLRAVITQNVDDLHEEAGNSRVIKLHGDLYRLRCLKCKARRSMSRTDMETVRETLAGVKPTRRHLVRAFREVLPRCAECGGTTRPDVVFFGESLPQADLAEALSEAETCEIMLVVGTSGVVYPAASIPQLAKKHGALIAEFGMEPTGMTGFSDFHFLGPAGQTLAELMKLLS